MNRDKPDNNTPSLEALSVFRGVYKRVAVHLDVDPSYVSRVARGERNAAFVSEALRKEIQRVLGKAGLHNGHGGDGKNHDHSNGTLAALLDGHSTHGNRGDGHARNGRLIDDTGNHTSVGKKKTDHKRRQTNKSTPVARKHKP